MNHFPPVHTSHLQLAGRVAFSYQTSDFVQPMSQAADHLQGLRLSDQELAMYLDLGPYANPSYYVVQVRCRSASSQRVGVHSGCIAAVWTVTAEQHCVTAAVLYSCGHRCLEWAAQRLSALPVVYLSMRCSRRVPCLTGLRGFHRH